MKKRIVAFLLTTIMLMSSMSQVMAISFSDVPAEHWANEYITTLSDQGVINGYEDGTFKPSGKITRAEFVKLMTVATIGEEKANSIVVPDEYHLANKWYGKYFYWAEENEIIINQYSSDKCESPIMRLDMAMLLYSYSEYLGLFDYHVEEIPEENIEEIEKDNKELPEEETVTKEDSSLKMYIEALENIGNKDLNENEYSRYDIENIINELSEEEKEEFNKEILKILGVEIKKEEEIKYNDIDTLSKGEKATLNLISKLEFINGYEDGSFKPYKFMNRAEVATIIYRYNKKK